MAVKKPLVLGSTQMVEQLQAGDTISGVAGGSATASLTTANDLVPGSAVRVTTDDACATAFAAGVPPTTQAVGLSTQTIAATNPAVIQFTGLMTLTTGQWDAVTGDAGGLVAGDVYYLDPDTAGNLTSTPPSTAGDFVQVIGTALSTTTMLLQIGEPVGL